MTRDEVMKLSDVGLKQTADLILHKDTRLIRSPDGQSVIVQDYANDIAAAWELAELAGISVIRSGDEWWAGKFDGSNGDWWFDLGQIIDTSAPRSITRAFILAMEADGTT